ncbi:unnamed protein product [marine sediment metagenome]|uniref:Uncharacterized protein n=1 Tax=marine sediment metagenome TaxID=412755 RepID=X0T6B9_9ZZZZ
MKQTINLHQFRDAFKAIRPDNFSYEGLEVLYDWFNEFDDSCGNETELDVIGICCEFNESTEEEIKAGYIDRWQDKSLTTYYTDDFDVEDYLNERTLVCGRTSDSIVYQAF